MPLTRSPNPRGSSHCFRPSRGFRAWRRTGNTRGFTTSRLARSRNSFPGRSCSPTPSPALRSWPGPPSRQPHGFVRCAGRDPSLACCGGRATAEDAPHVRVEACNTCKFYLRTIDLTRDGNAIPLVDDLAAVAHTLWANEQGYTRLQPNLLGT